MGVWPAAVNYSYLHVPVLVCSCAYPFVLLLYSISSVFWIGATKTKSYSESGKMKTFAIKNLVLNLFKLHCSLFLSFSLCDGLREKTEQLPNSPNNCCRQDFWLMCTHIRFWGQFIIKSWNLCWNSADNDLGWPGVFGYSSSFRFVDSRRAGGGGVQLVQFQ